MRKYLLLTSAILIAFTGFAQLVPTQTQAWIHITPNATAKKLIDVDNVGSSAADSYWEIIQDEVKGVSAWDVEYCDCNNCYSFKDYPISDTCAFAIAPNDFVSYSLQIKPGSVIQDGDFKVVVHNLSDGSETDTMTFKVSSQAATGFQDRFSESGYQLYPNPVRGEISITGITGGEHYRVLDISGKEIVSTSLPLIDVSSLSSGAYLLEIKSGDTSVRQRFMKD